ncbi:maleylpyruvate isomerase family mycothiol-dependent enzyme [Tenggerimyces flavus]|uniref:Maleylpyruvate isomerase family mycothiol-dependent enzyme n=1 Tax=Tenggerimyces flavus TaxID=1708749 RepID=A0ABV7Y579_9ACTN|nr:maleylpyruvate isomerase family mycothiol-dependent enzyme [Tenggerimyces flavus]MBM7791100.1 uncharacterized protein (TIGR03083 family) [Tenggerimyces flavus]
MTQQPYGAFDPKTYQAVIRREADAFVAAYAHGDPEAHVKACPGWTLTQLVDHVGQVHQWARGIVLGEGPGDVVTTPAEDGEDLADWYERCVGDLLETLARTDPSKPCWTMQPENEVARFWSRRQALELVVHRVDAEVAVGGSVRIDGEVAADGIAEVLDLWLPRITRRSGTPDLAAPVLLACTDRAERWLLRPPHTADVPMGPPTADGPVLADDVAKTAEATIEGTAAGLLMMLWKRQNVSVAGVSLSGEVEVAQSFLESRLTA